MTTTVVDPTSVEPTPLELAHKQFRQELLDAGLLFDTGVAGVYGRAAGFEAIVDGLDGLLTSMRPTNARVLRFPPVFARQTFEATEYISSFPHLAGTVQTFTGDTADHRELLAARAEGRDWDGWFDPAQTVLVPAACHPVYPLYAGTVNNPGAVVDVHGYCFRHEPSVDPARMQSFRMREFVRIGDPDVTEQHRDEWIARAQGALTDLRLPFETAGANDPFFGRVGRLLAVNQRDDGLKVELVVRLYGDLDDGTAVVSGNCHREHFGEAFAITTADGAVAHSACVGFGLERLALGLLRTHGLDFARWPEAVRKRLSL
ncbi:amino acid--[acyl-carrier-protein] ligase [Rhodococcus sp. O3]|uniref:amino acid--[acyl-carrier-protein] ligase n=1 Tax=Rhodococcus sp. O3 TaxID=3404919 RepID=UPI003B67BAD8